MERLWCSCFKKNSLAALKKYIWNQKGFPNKENVVPVSYQRYVDENCMDFYHASQNHKINSSVEIILDEPDCRCKKYIY